MTRTCLINENHGVVGAVSSDRTKITIRLPRGGKVEANNEGFTVGDSVAFTLNPLGNRVLSVMHKSMADFMVRASKDPVLQAALRKEEVYDDGTDEFGEDCPDFGPVLENHSHYGSGEHREIDEDWKDWPGDQIEEPDAPWSYY